MHITNQLPLLSDITADSARVLPEIMKLGDINDNPGLRQARMLDQISGMYSSIFGSKSGPDRFDVNIICVNTFNPSSLKLQREASCCISS